MEKQSLKRERNRRRAALLTLPDDAAGGMERRNRARVDLTMRCRAWWENTGVDVQPTTENLSASGILLRWDRKSGLPRIGDNVMVEVDLPFHPSFGRRCLSYGGKVVRVDETASGEVLVGIKSVRSRIVEASPAAPGRPAYIN